MKKFFAVGAVAVIGAMAFASAAALGTISGASLGAADALVEACDTTGVTVGYTTHYESGVGYVVDTVELSDLDACDTLTAAVQLTSDGVGTPIAGADGSAAVTGTTASIPLTTPPLAADVNDVHILISN